jgi:O-antigen/teichoic acid export membrane protein
MSLTHTGLFTWNEAAMARFWAGEAPKDGGAAHSASVYGAWRNLLLLLPLAALAAWLLPLPPGVKTAVLAGIAVVAPRTFAKLAQERRRAAGEVKSAALLDVAQTLGGFLLGALLARLGLGGAAPLLGLGLAALAVIPFVAAGEWRRAASARPERARIGRHLAYGLPVACSLILALVLSTTDRFLLATFLTPADVGVYHAGYNLANRTLDVAFIWLGAAGGPALIMALERGGLAALTRSAREQADIMVLLTVPAAAGLALVACPLAHLLVGPALADGAARVTPWIALAGLLGGFTTYYFHQAFTLAKRTPRLLTAMAIPAATNLLLCLLLIPRFGLDGALWATPISYGVGLLASWGLGRSAIALPLPVRAFCEALGGVAVMALAVSRIPDFGGALELFIKSGVGAAVYGAVMIGLDAGGLRSRALELLRARRLA